MARLIAIGTVGILYPAGVHGPVHKCPRLYFTDEFLHNPPTMWTVTPAPSTTGTTAEGWHYGRYTFGESTYVRYNNSSLRATWRLTGPALVSPVSVVYQGRWSD